MGRFTMGGGLLVTGAPGKKKDDAKSERARER